MSLQRQDTGGHEVVDCQNTRDDEAANCCMLQFAKTHDRFALRRVNKNTPQRGQSAEDANILTP